MIVDVLNQQKKWVRSFLRQPARPKSSSNKVKHFSSKGESNNVGVRINTASPIRTSEETNSYGDRTIKK